MKKFLNSILEPIPANLNVGRPKDNRLAGRHHVVPQWFLRRWGGKGEIVGVVRKNQSTRFSELGAIEGIEYRPEDEDWQSENSPLRTVNDVNPKDHLGGVLHSNSIWFDGDYFEFEHEIFNVVDREMKSILDDVDVFLGGMLGRKKVSSEMKKRLALFVSVMSLRANKVTSLVLPKYYLQEEKISHDSVMRGRLASLFYIASLLGRDDLALAIERVSGKVGFYGDYFSYFKRNCKKSCVYSRIASGKCFLLKTRSKSFVCGNENFTHAWFPNETGFPLSFSLSSDLIVCFTLSSIEKDSLKGKDEFEIARISNYQSEIFSDDMFFNRNSDVKYSHHIFDLEKEGLDEYGIFEKLLW